ncbi:serine protease [Pseudonocardiaceae bacterium YIM PH 21723]|nr:serine protease [Pseudonocardiaceae bacterium YIM PH 21723]
MFYIEAVLQKSALRIPLLCRRPFLKRILALACAALGALALVGTTQTALTSEPVAQPQRIIGGTPVQTPYSFYALLMSNGRGGCGASLIAPQWLTTATHCISSPTGKSVRIGSTSMSSGGEVINVGQVIKGPSDLTLIKLVSPSTKTPIKLASVAPAPGQVHRLIGHGATNPNNGPMSEQLMEVDVSVVANNSCSQGGINALELCYQGSGGKSACHGDSGGPSVFNGELYGATHGPGIPSLDCAGGLGIYESIFAQKAWINQQTGGAVSAWEASLR